MGSRPSQFTLTSPTGPIRLYSLAELFALPDPTWLIRDIMPTVGFIGVFGQPGCGKSFLAIDLAMCVATGTPWQGHEVEQGHVVYIAAEGGRGIKKRFKAWMQMHPTTQPDIAVAIEPIAVHPDSEGMAHLQERIDNEVRKQPKLIVIDTLARCFDGDENMQEDMGRFVAGVDWLRHGYDAAILIVHHTNVSGQRERGNTAFRGAADTMIAVTKEYDEITVACDKQKDDEEFKPLKLELQKVEGTGSCVIGSSHQIERTSTQQALVLETLTQMGLVSWDEWRLQCEPKGIGRGEFSKHCTKLQKAKVVEKIQKNKKTPGKWRVVPPPANP